MRRTTIHPRWKIPYPYVQIKVGMKEYVKYVTQLQTTNDQSILLWRRREPACRSMAETIWQESHWCSVMTTSLKLFELDYRTARQWLLLIVHDLWKHRAVSFVIYIARCKVTNLLQSIHICKRGVWQPDLALVTVLRGHVGLRLILECDDIAVWQMCGSGKGLPVFIWWKWPSRPCCKGGFEILHRYFLHLEILFVTLIG